jgi:hypothetical protein
MQERGKMKE